MLNGCIVSGLGIVLHVLQLVQLPLQAYQLHPRTKNQTRIKNPISRTYCTCVCVGGGVRGGEVG